MNIGHAAKQSGLTSKAIRHYEAQALLPDPKRNKSGYRDYNEHDVNRLRFIARARSTGFSLEECRVLMNLYSDEQRHSKDVKQLTLKRIEQLDKQIENMIMMRDELKVLAASCSGDETSHCAIINSLAQATPEAE